MKKRHSIATRILLFFVLLVSLTILLAVTNIISLTSLNTRTQDLLHTHLPPLVNGAQIAQIGGRITNDANILATHYDRTKIESSKKRLGEELPNLQLLIAPHFVNDPRASENLFTKLTDNLDAIFENSIERLELVSQLNSTNQRLHWLQVDFTEEVEPLLADGRYNVDLWFTKSSSTTELNQRLLKQEIDTLSQLTELRSNVNLTLDLLQRVSLFTQTSEVIAAQNLIDESIAITQEQSKPLNNVPSTVTLRQMATQLEDYAYGPSNPVDTSLKVILLTEQNEVLLEDNAKLIEQIKTLIDTSIQRVNSASELLTSQQSQLIQANEQQMNASMTAILILTLVIVWYLRTQILNRLSHILWTMRHLARGEEVAPLDARGKDELARLAEATNVFQKRTLQVREYTDQLEQNNQLMRQEIQIRIEAEQKLKTTHRELIQAGKLAVLGQLTTGIVHEFSQPLAAIQSNSYLLEQYLENKRYSDAAVKLKKIDQIADRATKLCQHLKSFARQSDEQVQPTPLLSTWENALQLFTEKLISIEVNTSIDSDLLVAANPIRLEQVFVNLLSNSIDAVEAKKEQQHFAAHIEVSAQLLNKQVLVRFRDNGCGMSQDDIDQLFEPFFTTKEVGKGLGLGMSISHNIITDFGGKITVSSQPSLGTEVQLCLNTTSF